PIVRSALAPRAAPAIDAAQLDAERGGLNRVEARVDADRVMAVLRVLAVRAEQFDFIRQRVVACRDESAVADAAQILRRKKRIAAEIAYRARGLAAGARAERLRRVLDDADAMFVGERGD